MAGEQTPERSDDPGERILVLAGGFTPPPELPVHAAITGWLRSLIADGVLKPGDRLPAERALAGALGISRMTLRQALGPLQAGGHLVRTVGAGGGSFVASPRPTVDISDLVGLSAQLLRTVPSVSSRLISADTVSSGREVARRLDLGAGAPVHRIVRVRYADDVPVVLERSYFPAALLPEMLALDLAGSLYELLRERFGREPVTAEEELLPVLPDRDDADTLGLGRSDPALRINRTARAGDGVAVEYSEDIFRSDRLRIVVSGRLQRDR